MDLKQIILLFGVIMFFVVVPGILVWEFFQDARKGNPWA